MEYESNKDKEKKLLIEKYIWIKSHLKYIIIHLQKFKTWKIQLTVAIDFVSSKDANETWTMYSKSDNIEVMTYNNPDEIIEKLLH